MKKIEQVYIWIANKLNETDDKNDKEYLYSISEYLSQTEEGKNLETKRSSKDNDNEELLRTILDEVKHSEISGLWKPNYKEGFNDGIAKAVEVVTKHFDKCTHPLSIKAK